MLFNIKRLQKLSGILSETEQENEKKLSNISYTGIVLTEASHNELIEKIRNKIPKNWKIVAHHVTVNLGPYKGDINLLNSVQKLNVNSFAINNRICAVGVIMPLGIPSKNINPHITIALNLNPESEVEVTAKESNNLQWETAEALEPFPISGKLIEVVKDDNSFASA